jgi:hypothetical protein
MEKGHLPDWLWVERQFRPMVALVVAKISPNDKRHCALFVDEAWDWLVL